MKSKFSEFMRGALPTPAPEPHGVRQAQFIPATATKPPTRRQVATWLAPPPQCPQELGLAEVCDCRDHRGDPIHGFREFGQPMARVTGNGGNIFPVGTSDPLMLQDAEKMTERINFAAEAAQAAYLASIPPPPPEPVVDAIENLRDELAILRYNAEQEKAGT